MKAKIFAFNLFKKGFKISNVLIIHMILILSHLSF